MSAKKPSFATRKPTPVATPVAMAAIEERFDLDAFERKVVAEARANNEIRQIPKELIDPDPNQPRSEFDQDAMNELRASIEQNGLIQPIVVRQVGDRYQIIAGERRWRACQGISGIGRVDAVIRNDVDPLTILLLQIAENNHRQSMTPMDIARAYQRVKELTGGSQKHAASKLGISESQMSITLGLLKSPELIQELAKGGKIRDITTLNMVNRLHEQNPEEARRVVNAIVEGRIEPGSVRKQVNQTLQQSKGRIEHAQDKKHRIKADTLELAQEGESLLMRFKSRKVAYEVELPLDVANLQAMISSLKSLV